MPPPQGLTLQTAVTSWPWLGSRPRGSCAFGGCPSPSQPPALPLHVLVWWEVMAGEGGGCLGTPDGWGGWPWEPEAGGPPQSTFVWERP